MVDLLRIGIALDLVERLLDELLLDPIDVPIVLGRLFIFSALQRLEDAVVEGRLEREFGAVLMCRY